jgi:mRNA interferase YafQ
MVIVRKTTQFKKDVKRAIKQGKDISLLDEVIRELAKPERLDERYKNHALTGNFVGVEECRIKTDWLLLYRYERTSGGSSRLDLVRTGSHADILNK